jgi:hypothetical protein
MLDAAMAVAVIVTIMVVVVIVVVMIMAVAGVEKFRLEFEDAIEIEGATLQHVGQRDLAALGAVQFGVRIDAADPRLRTMTSANAIWFLASGASFRRSLSHFASATVTTASSRAFFCTSSSTKKVCATGAGSARPVVSTMMASNLPLRFISPSRMRTRSPRTVQHMQPLFISNTSSSAPMIRSLSMPISPNSLTMTAYFLP